MEEYIDLRLNQTEIDLLKKLSSEEIEEVYEYRDISIFFVLSGSIIKISNKLEEGPFHCEYASLEVTELPKGSVDFTKHIKYDHYERKHNLFPDQDKYVKYDFKGRAKNIFLVQDEMWWHYTDWNTMNKDYIHGISHVAIEIFEDKHCLVITVGGGIIWYITIGYFDYKEDEWRIGSNPWPYQSNHPDKLIRMRVEI